MGDLGQLKSGLRLIFGSEVEKADEGDMSARCESRNEG